jgi:hypothetical protein
MNAAVQAAERRPAEVPDDRGVSDGVERLDDERAERRNGQPDDAPVEVGQGRPPHQHILAAARGGTRAWPEMTTSDGLTNHEIRTVGRCADFDPSPR